MMASVPAGGTAAVPNEEELRRELRIAIQKLKKREPLDATYKRVLMNGLVTARRPVLPKGRIYKRIGSGLRDRVEKYMEMNQGKDPSDKIAQRKPMEDEKMSEALRLRESKEHEQQPLLEANISALPRRKGMDEMSCRRHLEAIASGLQAGLVKPPPRPVAPSAAEQTELARQQAEIDKKQEEAKAREKARIQREAEERRKREEDAMKRRNTVENAQQALHKFCYRVFQHLWDMDFVYLGGTNPFRIVIDRENCAAMGAPDYFTIVETPMNLTYVQKKLDDMAYTDFAGFLADIDLMLKNAVKYNSDPNNLYRKAAEEMRKKHLALVKKMVAAQKQSQKR